MVTATLVLVQAAQRMEQQRPAGLAEGEIAKLVQNDQVRAQQARRDPPGAILRLLA
jgi:hypothetical protein